MRKIVVIILLAGSLALGGAPTSAEAAGLGRLLGARPTVTVPSSPAISRPTPATRPAVGKPTNEFGSVDSLHHATPKFPILRKLVKLYLLWLLFNPYR
uniref:Uncharacterized protein n=1 Tax=Schlesneria paludicola TaxID=360056 RepID=A0A7C2JYI7_9PLAN